MTARAGFSTAILIGMRIFRHGTCVWGIVCEPLKGAKCLHVQQLKGARVGMIFVVWRWTGKTCDSTDRCLVEVLSQNLLNSECWSGISVTLWWILGYRLSHFCYPHAYLGVFNLAVFWNVNRLETKDSCTVTTKMLNLIIVQQDASYSVYYISVGSSTCFGCRHTSSAARTAVITASGID